MTSREVGERGEALALRHYMAKGYKLLAQNYRTRMGEVDLIVQNATHLVFAEVKARKGDSIARPKEWVDGKKQRRIIAAAKAYLAKNRLSDPFLRFDVVEVVFAAEGENTGNTPPAITCHENAFDAY